MNKLKAYIFDIKRFAIHDGPGIRTTVFFRGCPLKCKWCHNPEGICESKTLFYSVNKCSKCRECTKICSCHMFKDETHIIDRTACIGCGKCTNVCSSEALRIYDEEVELDDLLKILIEDKEFYDESNGGVTLSGGECLLQPTFCRELLKKLKVNNINTAIDTCGYVDEKSLDLVMPYTDIFLYDLKAIDDDIHIKYTGKSNKIILRNLEYIDSCNVPFEIRIPIIPTVNENQIETIGHYLLKRKNLIKVKVLPYHDYAKSKYEALGLVYSIPEIKNADSIITKKAVHTLTSMGINAE